MERATAQVIALCNTPNLAAVIAGRDQMPVGDMLAATGFACVPAAAAPWEHVGALASLLNAFCLGDPARTVLQARLSVVPGSEDDAPTVSAALLIGVTRSEPAVAVQVAEDLAHDLARILARGAGFRAVPLVGADALRRALVPFEIVDGAEFGV